MKVISNQTLSGDDPAHRERTTSDTTQCDPHKKCAKIVELLEGIETITVAYSGGVDSTFIAWLARNKLHKHVRCIFADTPFISERERADALKTAEELGLTLEIIKFNPLDSAEIRGNSVNRCYFCKKEVFRRVIALAAMHDCKVVVDGSHAGDTSAYRPGKKALSELGVISPLARAGLVKEEIRRLSFEAGISNWDKPSQSCLATRIPYGTTLSLPLLQLIDKAEEVLHGLDFSQVRVRYHGDLARIEIQQADFSGILEPEMRAAVVKQLGQLGFSHICLDLAGFRSGSWDEKGVSNNS